MLTTAELKNILSISVAWKGHNVHTFIASCGTTILMESLANKKIDEDGNVYYKSVGISELI